MTNKYITNSNIQKIHLLHSNNHFLCHLQGKTHVYFFSFQLSHHFACVTPPVPCGFTQKYVKPHVVKTTALSLRWTMRLQYTTVYLRLVKKRNWIWLSFRNNYWTIGKKNPMTKNVYTLSGIWLKLTRGEHTTNRSETDSKFENIGQSHVVARRGSKTKIWIRVIFQNDNKQLKISKSEFKLKLELY